ncbi:hypothetical protein Taro_002771 [Colocasia esculenta]|uniref:Uncharacterized protein n=1 Tax=Colocasia esculenta TaxID=4460 RepID=A0A843TLS0_COLES|nr:hypothetical protein [Colocasia esculenta]
MVAEILSTKPLGTSLHLVGEFLAVGEQAITHTKPFFFLVASAATCIDSHLEVDQRRRPCERDDPIGRILRSCRDSKLVAL